MQIGFKHVYNPSTLEYGKKSISQVVCKSPTVVSRVETEEVGDCLDGCVPIRTGFQYRYPSQFLASLKTKEWVDDVETYPRKENRSGTGKVEVSYSTPTRTLDTSDGGTLRRN